MNDHPKWFQEAQTLYIRLNKKYGISTTNTNNRVNMLLTEFPFCNHQLPHKELFFKNVLFEGLPLKEGIFSFNFHAAKDLFYDGRDIKTELLLFVKSFGGSLSQLPKIEISLNRKYICSHDSNFNLFKSFGVNFRAHTFPGKNSISFISNSPFVFQMVWAVSLSSRFCALQLLASQKLPIVDCLEFIRKQFSESIISQRLSLRCPLSQGPIRLPARSHACKHTQCFDLYTFLDFVKGSKNPRCPICLGPCSHSEIIIDIFFFDILLSLDLKNDDEDEPDCIYLFENGMWQIEYDANRWNNTRFERFMGKSKLFSNQSEEKEENNDDDDDDDEEDKKFDDDDDGEDNDKDKDDSSSNITDPPNILDESQFGEYFNKQMKESSVPQPHMSTPPPPVFKTSAHAFEAFKMVNVNNKDMFQTLKELDQRLTPPPPLQMKNALMKALEKVQFDPENICSSKKKRGRPIKTQRKPSPSPSLHVESPPKKRRTHSQKIVHQEKKRTPSLNNVHQEKKNIVLIDLT